MEWDAAGRSAKENYQFLCAAVAPRPIAWVTTVSAGGLVNVAPFSWFNAVHADPPMVMLAIADRADGSPKDTVRNLRANGQLVVHVVPAALAQRMVATSAEYPPDVSEASILGLATTPSRRVAPPRLVDSPVSMEAEVESIRPLGNAPHTNLVLARIVHIHADDAVLDAKGNPDPERLVLAARMGGSNYCDTSPFYPIARPAPVR